MTGIVYFCGKIEILFINYYQTPWKLSTYVFIYHFYFLGAKFISEYIKNQKIIKDIETQNIEMKLKALKNQIDPHFLFNSINTIYGLSLKKDNNTPIMILKLSDMLRYVIDDTHTSFVYLQNELDYIRNYIDFAKLRLKDNSKLKCVVIGETYNQKIAPMILITFIENGFKHGLYNVVGESYLFIEIIINKDKLILKTENNYNSKPDFHGIGLSNTIKRLDLIYSNKYILDIFDNNKIYKIYFELELN